jgi:hypothetical protein
MSGRRIAACVAALTLLLAGCKDTGANPTCDELHRKVDSARRSAADRPGDEGRQHAYQQARRRYNNAACPGQV